MLTRYHAEVTASALREHFSPQALKAIIAANLQVDNLAGLLVKPWAHFDNNLIREGNAYIEQMRAAAAEAAANGERQGAWAAFGILTHTAQDFYSHTDYVDRWLEKHGGLAAIRPEQMNGLEPDLLDEATLRSGDFRLIPDVVYYLPGLARIARRWFVRAGSHEAMHLDSPERGPRFYFSIVAARQRTLHEYQRTLTAVLAAGGVAAADCFHGTIRQEAGKKVMTSSHPRGLYFEEFSVGQKIVSAGRTITESDIVRFAGLSGDFNQIHTDAVFSQSTPFGQRVAHGLLVLSITSGLAVQTGFMEGTILAFREINEWKFSAPVYIGDTVHVELNVLETKALPRLGGGAVVIALDVKNQKGETVHRGKWTALMNSKPKES